MRIITIGTVAAFLISCGGPDDTERNGNITGQTYTGDSMGGDPGPLPGVEINGGWLGGACENTNDCDNADIDGPECLTSGFPNGFCTQDCSQSASTGNWVCPDTDYSGMNTWSRCIDANGSPKCVTECDFGLSPQTGCRPGYTCVMRARYAQPDSVFSVCLPADTGRWPGEPAPGIDIGNPCVADGDCEHAICLPFQDGYCSQDCSVSLCPDGSTCFTINFGDDAYKLCLDDCAADSECRDDVNYVCDSDGDVCWPGPTPAWDSSVGAADCAAAWGNLHACDTTPDDYIVINKSARNVALCENGTHKQSFHGALGFSPIGDKVQNGDGKTPEGVFYIPRVLPSSQYYKAFLLSYPDSDDASRGVSAGLITQSVANEIESAQDNCLEPPQSTGLGGYIELHGTSQTGAADWTWGCIAVENAAIDDYLWDGPNAVGVGDTIIVKP